MATPRTMSSCGRLAGSEAHTVPICKRVDLSGRSPCSNLADEGLRGMRRVSAWCGKWREQNLRSLAVRRYQCLVSTMKSVPVPVS